MLTQKDWLVHFPKIQKIIQFQAQNNFAISFDFSLSLRMIPAFDPHSLIVLQTTDEPIFLENIFPTGKSSHVFPIQRGQSYFDNDIVLFCEFIYMIY